MRVGDRVRSVDDPPVTPYEQGGLVLEVSADGSRVRVEWPRRDGTGSKTVWVARRSVTFNCPEQ